MLLKFLLTVSLFVSVRSYSIGSFNGPIESELKSNFYAFDSEGPKDYIWESKPILYKTMISKINFDPSRNILFEDSFKVKSSDKHEARRVIVDKTVKIRRGPRTERQWTRSSSGQRIYPIKKGEFMMQY